MTASHTGPVCEWCSGTGDGGKCVYCSGQGRYVRCLPLLSREDYYGPDYTRSECELVAIPEEADRAADLHFKGVKFYS